jgi:hypothetical protein
VLQKAASKERVEPSLPLGARGRWKGKLYEIIGFQRRTIVVDGFPYDWFEYLLFNPYAGYRYLTEYEGHWNDVILCQALPEHMEGSGYSEKPTVRYQGRAFSHFQTADARTTYIAGEFPWQVRINDLAKTRDYISPPFILSSESTEAETTWSIGEYTSGKDVFKAFNPKQNAPAPVGIFANQPSPWGGSVGEAWKTGGFLLAAAFVVLFLAVILSSNKIVFRENYTFSSANRGEPSFVTETFRLEGRTSNVEIDINSNVDNSWAYLSMALINSDTGDAYDVGREVSYYHGYDEDGSWSEGSRNDEVTLPHVPPGNYYLRVEPEVGPSSSAAYTITVRRDVPSFLWFLIATGALIIPPALISFRSYRFEFQRWQDSDYAADTSDDDE